jgi:FtsZ-binding cell division protein ZapB
VHRLFASVIAPLIEALEPRRIVETGAGTGRLTRRVLDTPGAHGAVLHALDPSPALDPRLIEAAGERLQLHEERAISAIGHLGPVDLALLDGDPNWYSVHSELTIAARAAERASRPAPLAVVHNIHWPFGRRDGYYDPAVIPSGQRRQYTDLGLVPGQRDPRMDGLRLAPYCAVRDFEPRSGVLSAVEDVIAESDLDWTLIEVPGFHGAAVLAEARLLERHPAIGTVLEELSSSRFLGHQARRAESARLAAEAELAAVGAHPAEEAEPEPAPVETPEPVEIPEPVEVPEPVAPEPAPDLVRELEADRAALLAEAAEHRAQREAYEWRAGRLMDDLATQVDRLNALVGERDAERRTAVEAQVRLENTTEGLARETAAASELRGRVSELEAELRLRQGELSDLTEREKLSQGRLAHTQDSIQALEAERDRLRKEVDGLGLALATAGAQLDEIAEHLRWAGLSRRARAARRLSTLARTITFRQQPSPGHLEAAREVAERALPPAGPAPGHDEASGHTSDRGEIDLRRSG